VVPTAYACSRCWKVKGSWTDLVIPKPFANVFLVAGEPIRVPPALGRDELQPYATLIQAEMDRLNDTAERLSEGWRRKDPVLAPTAQELPCRTNG
jgi:lysophospholipid acyltransferase (LPLAT)-like uncharacterized protein